MKRANLSDVQNITQSVAKAGGKILITGEPGAGKNFISAKLMRTPKNWCFLDQLGKLVGKDWIVKLSDDILNTKVVFTGTCTNMDEVVQQIIASSHGTFLVLYINPTPELWKMTQAAKARDLEGDSAGVDHMRSMFAANAKLSIGAIKKRLAAKERLYYEKASAAFDAEFGTLDGFYFLTIENKLEEGAKPIKGWHEQTEARIEREDEGTQSTKKEVDHAK